MYIPKNAFYNPNFNPYKVNCEQQTCDGFDAFVNCITNILQGRWGCVEIQLVDKFGQPLDLSAVRSIEVILTNSLGYYMGSWGWVKNHIQPSSENILDVYQRPIGNVEDRDIWVEWQESGSGSDEGKDSGSGSGKEDKPINVGLIGLSIPPSVTYTTTGAVTAQVIITTDESGVCNTYVVPCIVLANIVKNMVNEICDELIDDPEGIAYKNLNKVIIPVSIQEIPFGATVTEVYDIEDIDKVGYYKVDDVYYKCDYYKSEYDDKDKWVIYTVDKLYNEINKLRSK